MRRLATAWMATLLLAGCGQSGGDEPTKVQSIKVDTANPYQQQLEKLSDVNRGLALRRAVQDSGQRCKRANASAFQGEYKSLKMWTLRCSDTGDWALFLAPNGDVQARACKDTTQLGLPPCVTGPLEKPAG
jgi:outer membrane murein-binding lipoprotein Lpp